MSPKDITELLVAHGKGDEAAFDQLVPLVYGHLRRIARVQLRLRRPGDTLGTTGLVHEAYMRLVDQTRASFRDRAHFFAVSSMAMRQIVVDHARRRLSLKRGGGMAVVAITDVNEPAAREAAHILDVDEALRRLGAVDERLVRIVECRYFGGLTEEETAATLGISVRTAQREWFKARAWLRRELGGGR